MAKIGVRGALLAATILSCGVLTTPAFAQTNEELMNKGLAAENQQYWSAAEGFYKQILARDPSRADLWERLSDIIAKEGRPLDAADALAKAADLNPGDANLQDKTAKAYSAAGSPEKALEYENKALEAQSDNALFLQSKSANETWLGRYAEAEASLRQAFANGLPENEENLLKLAKLQQWQNKLDASLETLKRINKLNPNNLDYLVAMTRLYSWRGDFKKAVETIDEYASKGGDPLVAAREKSVVLAWNDKPKASLAASADQLSQHPDDEALLIGRTIAYSRAHDYDNMFATLKHLDEVSGEGEDHSDLKRIVNTPIRSNLDMYFRASTDRDNIDFVGGGAVATIKIKPGTYFHFGGESFHIKAPAFGGLDRIDNVGSIVKSSAFAGFEFPLGKNAWFTFRGGESFTDYGPDAFMYDAKIKVRTSDSTFVTFGANRDLFTVSPRSLSLGIVNNQYYIQIDHSPNSDWFMQGRFEYDDLNDGNNQVLGEVTVIRSIMRHANFNISAGINAHWSGYNMTLSNGYYSPTFYQRYLVPVYMTFKFNDDDNLVITVAPGIHKDNTFTSAKFAGAADMQLTIGLYRDWMLKANFGAYLGGGSALTNATNYWIVAGGAHLVKRF